MRLQLQPELQVSTQGRREHGALMVTERLCLNSRQEELAENVQAYLLAHLDRHVTIDQLSAQFHVSATTVKSSFKAVCGTSIYAFTKQQKMYAAAELLRTGDSTVLEIAGRFGYDNASKFAGAFRSVMGVTPNEYRSKHRA